MMSDCFESVCCQLLMIMEIAIRADFSRFSFFFWIHRPFKSLTMHHFDLNVFVLTQTQTDEEKSLRQLSISTCNIWTVLCEIGTQFEYWSRGFFLLRRHMLRKSIDDAEKAHFNIVKRIRTLLKKKSFNETNLKEKENWLIWHFDFIVVVVVVREHVFNRQIGTLFSIHSLWKRRKAAINDLTFFSCVHRT